MFNCQFLIYFLIYSFIHSFISTVQLDGTQSGYHLTPNVFGLDGKVLLSVATCRGSNNAPVVLWKHAVIPRDHCFITVNR